jgi:ribosomal protein S18 acetylase RimI-like enzyme
MSVHIAELNETELAASAEVIRCSFATVASEFGLTRDNCPTNGAFLEDGRICDEYFRGIKMFGLKNGNEQIGFMALEQKDADTFYLEKLSILPEFRHTGYGGMMVGCAKKYVKQAGGNNISIGIIYENKRLLEWYRSLGFIETGTKHFDHLPFTVCFMRLDI